MASETPVSLTTAPKAGQLVKHEGKVYKTVQEGRAYILVPPKARTELDPRAEADDSESQKVFYNPIQQFNRDLSVLAIRVFGRDNCERKSLKREVGKGRLEKKKERKKEAKATGGGAENAGKDVSSGSGQEGAKADAEAGAEEGSLKRVREDDGDEQNPTKLRKGQEGERVLSSGEDAADGMEADQSNGDHEAPKEHTTTAQQAENGAESTSNQPLNHATSTDPYIHANGNEPWQPRFRVLDALSATGLRALRYAQEIPFATTIVANDMDRKAVQSIALNVKHNQLDSRITAHTGNAIGHMYRVAFPAEESHGPDHVSAKYDVIDLDPYGTAAPFIESALHALNDGGMLCVTCTDSGVFASCGYPEKTFSLYGGMPIKGPHSHEGGIRLILNSIANSAAKYGMAIEPLLSLSIDFYIRVFVRVRKSPADVKFLAGKTMLAYDCDAGCGAWTTQMLGRNQKQQGKGPNINWKHSIAQAPSAERFCEQCGSKTHIAGPMWAGPIHNGAFIERMMEDIGSADKEVYATTGRIEGMLDTALGELYTAEYVLEKGPTSKHLIPRTLPEKIDQQPFFVIPSFLAKVLHCQAPNEAAIKGALRHAGYKATRSHCKPGSVKTEAPWNVIWEIMREWARQKSPIKEGKLKENTAGWKIMQLARPQEEVSANGQKEAEKEANGTDNTPELVTKPEQKAGEATADNVKDVRKVKVVFDEVLGKDKPGRRLVRYQQNPRENWGPMARAK